MDTSDSSSITPAPSPADAVASWLVASLAAVPALEGVPVIRQSDESIDRAQCVVVADARDEGDHLGIPGHVLVDITAAMALWVHVTDDQTPVQTSALLAAIRAALAALPQGDAPPVDGWHVRYISGWTQGGLLLDGNDRHVELTATMLLQSAAI